MKELIDSLKTADGKARALAINEIVNGTYESLFSDLEKYNLELRGLTILYQRHKRIFPYGYPYAYVPNIHHQYIMILQNMKKA